MKKHSGAAHLIIVTIILALGLVGAIGYVVWDKVINKDQDSSSNVQENNNSTVDDKKALVDGSTDEVATDPYEGWKTYKTNQYKVSFRYPGDWSTKNETMFLEKDEAIFSIDVITNLNNAPTTISGDKEYKINDESFEEYVRNAPDHPTYEKINQIHEIDIKNGEAFFVEYKFQWGGHEVYPINAYSRNDAKNLAVRFIFDDSIFDDNKPIDSSKIDLYKKIIASIEY